MVTSLKRSKKIRAFCYRVIAVGALITAIATGIMGREALSSGMFSGSIYDLPEFREYIAELYYNAMIGYAGVGDDFGYPLKTTYAAQYARRAQDAFAKEVHSLNDDILYYLQRGKNVAMKNVDYPIFSEYDKHLLLPENMMLCCYWDGENGVLKFFDESGRIEVDGDITEKYYPSQYRPNRQLIGDITLILAVKEECSSNTLSSMAWKAERYQKVMLLFVASVATWLVFGLLSLCSGKAGRKAKEDFGKVSVKIWLEIKLIFLALLIAVLYYSDLFGYGKYLSERLLIVKSLWIYFPVGCLCYLLWVDFRQNLENVFANSLPTKCFGYIKDIVQGQPWYRRAMAASTVHCIGGLLLLLGGGWLIVFPNMHFSGAVGSELQICGGVMALAGIIVLFSFLKQRKFVKDTALVVDKLSELSEGRANVSLQLSSNSLLTAAAKDLNELGAGIERAVEQQNRSNRMRVELLTNVSHDLKTPLTSIVNYADLLCEEELPENAAAYATALQGKAYRLKNMVQDVFDLSKATSGNLKVEKAVIDLVKLIKQTLGDMDERIQESNLTFKLNVSAESLMIEADGEKLYRVFQNLFVNALQYSLDHSRVHIQLQEENGFAVANVKNTSRMELNFDPSEIVERFVRADSSRTTEGSGLGLSIVQSFVENCGGQFAVETDADMFTACVRFPLAERTVDVEPVEEEGDF